MAVSLCMIIRNEEDLIPEFLKHASGLYDQLVVVDTGSTDHSAAIFEESGAEVHSFTWQDDFALARNESLRYAKSEWILILDADEFPPLGFGDEMRALISHGEIGAATVERTAEQKNGIDRTSHLLRLFRNDPSITYRYRIHEDASASVKEMLVRTGTKLGHIRTPILHVGYKPYFMTSRNKQERDETLLKMAIEDDPADLYSRYKLLELYRFHSRVSEMAPVAQDCLTLILAGTKIVPPFIAGDLVEMMRSTLASDADAGLAFLEDMAPVAGHSGHYHLALGMQFEQRGLLDQAGKHFHNALGLCAADPAKNLIITRAAMGLSRLSLAVHDLDGARLHVAAARRVAPDDPEVSLASQYLNDSPR